ncbi:beta-glucosidase [Paenibacillus sambharensis]|uniref:Beta-glucosidase n=1 Tax=Paenibacillus sambharensis TaxID=1803190 RepID=A0A2W1LC29_9BACL|nr:glycoside hydrolase family 3 protein [Paenibacillus sambharensis]PZD96269.1 beta-glucosidase [Paenibacillus sambharensis]
MSTTNKYPFQNPDLPVETRINDLVSRMTLDEKINQMCQYQDEIPHLGVKPYKHGTEAAHGIAWLGEATTYPQPIGLACTWDEELLKRVGAAIGDEARAFYKRNPAVNGLTLWAPTVDMERDPRWGRTEEAYGEDPYLTGRLATELVKGLQGDHPFYLKAVASLKHFLGNNNEIDRGECSVSIDPRNMYEYYLPAFEMPFKEGGAQSMMTAYNSVNGVPANLNPDVVRIVKQQWGMNGFIVSDAGDVLGTVNDHKYHETYKESVALTIKSGIDSITDDADISKQAIRDALAEGLLTENDLDIALRNTFRVRFRLGEFDPDDRNPYAAIDESIILSPEHKALSLEATQKNIVLLKNENNLLPLSADKLNKVAVVGSLGGIVYRDWYSGTLPYAVTPLAGIQSKLPGKEVVFHNACDRIKLKSAANGKYVRLTDSETNPLAADAAAPGQASVFEATDWGWASHTLIAEENGKYLTTDDEKVTASSTQIWEWFTKEVFHVRPGSQVGQVQLTTWNDRPVKVDSSAGILSVQDGSREEADTFHVDKVTDGLKEAVEAARSAEVAVVVVGNHPLINGKETIDRPDITLAESQERLIREVHAVNPNTVVVIVGSYPYAINWVDANIPAVMYTSHAGSELGTAIADVLFGDYNPAGRLNMTWYQSVEQLPDFMDYDIIKGKRTYQYFDGDVLYPFGYGLSYSTFRYGSLKLDNSRISAEGQVTVQFQVTNDSSTAGEEVVQLYVKANNSRVKRPLKQLKGFDRLYLQPGETREVTMKLNASELAFWDVTRERYCVETGTYSIMIGASSADVRLQAEFEVDGEVIPPRDLRQVTRAVNYDDYAGFAGVIIDECREGGSSASFSAGGWIAFHDAELGEGITSLELRAASSTDTIVEIRIGRPDGKLAGTCTVPATGGAEQWQSFTCAIEGAAGRQSVYLIAQAPVKLSWFRFTV